MANDQYLNVYEFVGGSIEVFPIINARWIQIHCNTPDINVVAKITSPLGDLFNIGSRQIWTLQADSGNVFEGITIIPSSSGTGFVIWY